MISRRDLSASFLARIAPALLLTTAVAFLLTPGAVAHADLTSATPEPNTRIDEPPSELVLNVSERVEPGNLCTGRNTCIEMVSPDGVDHVANISVSESGLRITATLNALDDGLYTVRWRALSAVDGHTTSGAYLLGIRTDIPVGELPPATDLAEDASVTETILRAFQYAGASLLAGIPIFFLWTRRLGPPRHAAGLLRLAATGGIVAAVASVLLVAMFAARLELSLLEAARTTGYGGRVAWRALAFLAAGAVAWWAAARATAAVHQVLVVALAALALLLTSLASHAAAVPTNPALAIGADFIHQLAAAAWIGGLVALFAALARGADALQAAPFVARFSPLAMLAVLVLIATGVYGALLHVGDPLSPAVVPYTLALGAKIALILPLLLLGAWNRYILQPRLYTAPRGPALRRLRASVAAEVLLLAVVLVLTGVLTHASPPAAVDEDAPLAGEVLVWRTLDGHEFRVTVLPAPVTVGVQNLTLHLFPGPDGVPENAQTFITVWDPRGETTMEAQRLERVDGTRWSLQGVIFAEAGGWHVEILFQGRGISETRDLHVEVGGASGPGTGPSP